LTSRVTSVLTSPSAAKGRNPPARLAQRREAGCSDVDERSADRFARGSSGRPFAPPRVSMRDDEHYGRSTTTLRPHMPPPLAYFLTWTCHGQRLHGDDRGTVDRDHNTPGTPLLAADTRRQALNIERMKSAAVMLSAAMQAVVSHAVVQLCDERAWHLMACNVRSTHVHVVVGCWGVGPERVLAQFKARATRDLRLGGLVAPDVRLWTRHGSTRWINHETGLGAAIAYVEEWQDGSQRELLEAHRELLRERTARLKEWIATRR